MILILGFFAIAHASLNDFISKVNIQAIEDMDRFTVMAKEIGIKPGSKDFHELKRGELYFTGQPTEYIQQPGNGKGKGKGHKKD